MAMVCLGLLLLLSSNPEAITNSDGRMATFGEGYTIPDILYPPSEWEILSPLQHFSRF